ncbi:hypothetical protein ACFRR7_34695 [Streptomyces sp. NPDC056909]|uniref:hypothetical protein n=1 Tax=Streptomyces sp. NPDC056909 TaxID=3345963 RepID=UPI00368E2566
MTGHADKSEQKDQNTPGNRETPIPTPWTEFTQAADLTFRHKVGVIAKRGTREAEVGRDIALHAAGLGIPTLLYTANPPSDPPAHLVVDRTPHPTAAHLSDRMKYPPRGQRPQLVVVDAYERLRPEEHHAPDQYDPIDDLDYVPLTEAEQLLWSVRDIRVDVPLLLTTTIATQPDLSQPIDQWLSHDHPAIALTEVCKPVILLHRASPQAVEARMEINPNASHNGQRVMLDWPTC